jgi:nitroimidazol reductase NimA-like FMN-containing flavoprotein (pyridoxamine 5'-phosphate oxidase superfamily)
METKYHLSNRPNREITDKEEILKILKNGKYAVLSLCRNNEPYVVTLSYGYNESTNSLYFHCAKDGLKLNFIRTNPKVCATIIEDGGYILNECGHKYKTVVLWGNIKIISDLQEKRDCMKIILNQLESDEAIKNKKIDAPLSLYENVVALKLEIIEIHGKAGR